MSDLAIRVEHLGKEYQLGGQQLRYATFREALLQTAGAPLRWLKGERRARPTTFWALEDISFEVKHGEAVGIIGRNGAGKSTLLKILSRITSPTRGRVDIYGRVGSLLEVGTGFHPELTGRENIYLNGAILGMTRREIMRKFDEIVDFAEIEKFLDTSVKFYSSGMYVRLAFAVAAHLEPEILVVDEVLAVGDAEFQKKCLGKMGDVAHEGRTVLFVSHNMGSINDLCSRVLLLRSGFLVADGLPEDITQQYLSLSGPRQAHVEFTPTAKEAYFRSLTLCRDNDEPSVSFDIRKPFRLFMQFVVTKRIPGLQAAISIFNSHGTHIFYHSSGYTDPPLELENAGFYDLSVQLPGRFFTVGSYTINVALHIPKIALFDLREHILKFEIENTDSSRNDFSSESLGCVIVDLEWKMQGHLK